jgi:hypothetical protein
MVKFPSYTDPGFRRVIGILQEFRGALVSQRAEQYPQNFPNGYGRSLHPDLSFDDPLTSSMHTSAADSFEHARPNRIPNETCNYALSVDVFGFLKSAQFKKDDQDLLQTLQFTVSSFIHGGIQSFVKDIAAIDNKNGGQTTSGHDTQSPSTLRLLWVHVPINNTKWVHVCSRIAVWEVKY